MPNYQVLPEPRGRSRPRQRADDDEARKIHAARATGLLGYEEPDAHCLPQGVPKINMAPVPFRIVQTDKLVVLVYEAFNLWRQVHLDGRELADDLNPSWMGYSKGRWEGDALVVETRGLNGKQWLDHGGLPASDKLTVIERFRRPDFGQLEIEITITDPTYYTKPWTAKTVRVCCRTPSSSSSSATRTRSPRSTWARTSSSGFPHTARWV